MDENAQRETALAEIERRLAEHTKLKAINAELLKVLQAALGYIEKTETRPGKGAIRTLCVTAIARATTKE